MAQAIESRTLNFDSNSNQVEDAGQTPVSNQDAPQGGSQTEITQEVAGDNISQTEISNQTAAEDGTGTDIRHMDARFYKAAAEGNMNILWNMSFVYMRDKLTLKGTQSSTLQPNLVKSTVLIGSFSFVHCHLYCCSLI